MISSRRDKGKHRRLPIFCEIFSSILWDWGSRSSRFSRRITSVVSSSSPYNLKKICIYLLWRKFFLQFLHMKFWSLHVWHPPGSSPWGCWCCWYQAKIKEDVKSFSVLGKAFPQPTKAAFYHPKAQRSHLLSDVPTFCPSLYHNHTVMAALWRFTWDKKKRETRSPVTKTQIRPGQIVVKPIEKSGCPGGCQTWHKPGHIQKEGIVIQEAPPEDWPVGKFL